ncbi:transposase [candidate division KSB3 bacterium]|uniref:Transposase n=1 Tax=candidate division KSB3 bacterium TaxID=2044937 RepID=A0A9D5K034_9BACT|nr:transposase [candidate division KSB3 bacterium]MBD3327170.1 transposase [candidate division KSB3 bacterium]
MNIEYHRWWSPHLGHDMELKVYGHDGKAVLVFPTAAGRFYDYEDFDMVEACRPFLDTGAIKLFTVDSLDEQTWLNEQIHPHDRAHRYEDYDRYIVHEVVPFIRSHGTAYTKLMVTGCDLGGTHAANCFFKHPNVFDTLVALSGIYSSTPFLGAFLDDRTYYHFPLVYLPNLDDPKYLERYRESMIIFCVGQGAWEEQSLADTHAMRTVLNEKHIPAWVDVWGYDVNHDWPWWQKQIAYFLSHLPFTR